MSLKKECEAVLSKVIVKLFNDEINGGEFYAHIIAQMDRHVNDSIDTAAVNYTNRLNLYVNPDFFLKKIKNVLEETNDNINESLILLSQMSIIAHEILHVVFGHIYDFENYQNKQLANIAMDLVVNSCLNKSFLPGGLFPEDFDLPRDESVQYYYKNFPKEKYPFCLCDDGGKGDQNNPGTCGRCGKIRPIDDHSVWTKGNQAAKQAAVKEAVQKASNSIKDSGSLHKSIQDVIAKLSAPPIIPWSQVLKRFEAKITKGFLINTKKRISKRFGTRPGNKITTCKKIAVLPDVSGSISNDEYKVFFNEIFDIAKNANTTVIEWDTKICDIRSIKKYEPNITRHGSGGTNPTEAIEYINQNSNKFDGAIFFTDGHLFDKIVSKIRVPCLWVITNNGTDSCLQQQTVIKLNN